jgi:hypothetical protein
MDQYGRILSRNDLKKQFNPGIGDLTIPFPNQPVKPGNTWSIPEELPITLDTGTIKKVSIRQRYKLDKVEAGVATISVETQILTPVNDPKIQSQLVQRMQRGTSFEQPSAAPCRRKCSGPHVARAISRALDFGR